MFVSKKSSWLCILCMISYVLDKVVPFDSFEELNSHLLLPTEKSWYYQNSSRVPAKKRRWLQNSARITKIRKSGFIKQLYTKLGLHYLFSEFLWFTIYYLLNSASDSKIVGAPKLGHDCRFVRILRSALMFKSTLMFLGAPFAEVAKWQKRRQK